MNNIRIQNPISIGEKLKCYLETYKSRIINIIETSTEQDTISPLFTLHTRDIIFTKEVAYTKVIVSCVNIIK